jgi:hypothetical protein
MKNISKVLLATALFGGISLGLAPAAHADFNLVQNGDFTSFTSGHPPAAGTVTALAANTLSDWVNNTQIPGANSGNGGLGYNFVYTPNVAGNFNYSGAALPLWNISNGGVASIGEPAGYTGNIIGADGAYRQGPISQTISGLTVGDNYTVSFYYGGAQQESFNGKTTEAWQVSFGSSTQETPVLNNANHSFTGWYEDTLTFTADSTSDALSFLALGTPTGEPPFSMLADVTLVAAPEPSALIGGGLVVLAFGVGSLRMYRKQKQA